MSTKHTQGKWMIVNVDRQHCAALGGRPSASDRACVMDKTTKVPHPITGLLQPACVFSGTLAECYAYIAAEPN